MKLRFILVCSMLSIVTALANNNRIYGGSPDAKNQWTSAVALGLSTDKIFCSGVVVAPTKVLTAGHCATAYPGKFDTTGNVYFGLGGASGWYKTIPVLKVEIDPGYNRYGGYNIQDFALVTLKEAVPASVTIIPAINKAEAEILFAKRDIPLVQVGFGVRENGVHGEKYITENVSTRIFEKEYEAGLGEGHGVCFGDSGGPSFAKIKTGEWRVVGIASRVPANGRVCETYGQIFGRADAAQDWYSRTFYNPRRFY